MVIRTLQSPGFSVMFACVLPAILPRRLQLLSEPISCPLEGESEITAHKAGGGGDQGALEWQYSSFCDSKTVSVWVTPIKSMSL